MLEFLRRFAPEILLGAGAGLVVGALARQAARDAIGTQLLLGDERLAREVEAGRRTLFETAPPQIRAAVREPINAALAAAGLTRARARELVLGIERARALLGRPL